MVERTLIRPPNSRVGPVTDAERKAVIKANPVAGEYDETIDRESASEILQKRTPDHADADTAGGDAASKKKAAGSRSDGFWTTLGKTIIKSGVPYADFGNHQAAPSERKPGGGGGGFTRIG